MYDCLWYTHYSVHLKCCHKLKINITQTSNGVIIKVDNVKKIGGTKKILYYPNQEMTIPKPALSDFFKHNFTG